MLVSGISDTPNMVQQQKIPQQFVSIDKSFRGCELVNSRTAMENVGSFGDLGGDWNPAWGMVPQDIL